MTQANLPSNVNDIQQVAVIGAGTMGRGIAISFANAGINVTLLDLNEEVRSQAMSYIEGIYAGMVKRERITQAQADERLACFSLSGDYAEIADVQLAIEAVYENIDLKKKLFRALDEAIPAGVVLGTNTSSISITMLAAETSRPDLVVGMHFMNPVPVMKLVEIIRGLQTDDATYEATIALAKRMGKTTITSKDCPGFIVNRILIPLINEACFALQEGLGTPEDIDTGIKLGLNHPMGPLALADLIGLDTCLAIADVLHRELGDDKYRAANILRMHVAAGWHGRKAGRGFYNYSQGK